MEQNKLLDALFDVVADEVKKRMPAEMPHSELIKNVTLTLCSCDEFKEMVHASVKGVVGGTGGDLVDQVLERLANNTHFGNIMVNAVNRTVAKVVKEEMSDVKKDVDNIREALNSVGNDLRNV